MNRKPNFANIVLSILVGMTLLVSAAQPNLVSASTEYAGGEGIRTSVHPQTGKLSFLGADPSSPIRVDAAMRADQTAESRGMAILDAYGRQFGLKNPQEELRVLSSHDTEGRGTTKYQQLYQGIPVMAGELIVNTNSQGGLLSINGEVSPELDISITPSIDAALAQSMALQEIANAYGLSTSEVTASEPELWVYDARLMNGEDTTPAHLVWRMEVSSENAPLRELVLVNAQTGEMSLHFNQIDTAWTQNVVAKNELNDEQSIELEDAFSATIGSPTPGTNLFVDGVNGNDEANDCLYPASACLTINGAIEKPQAEGNDIYVTEGVYTVSVGDQFVVTVNKNVNIVGGWDSAFTIQQGYSVVDGEGKVGGINAYGDPYTILFDRIIVRNGSNGGVSVSSASVTIKNSAIYNNNKTGTYADGGGINNTYGDIYLYNVTINNNAAMGDISGNGGGVYSYGGSAMLTNVTITGNSSKDGGGIWLNTANQAGAAVRVKNVILYDNHASNLGPDCYGKSNVNANNLVGDTTDCSLIVADNGNLLNVDPKLGTFFEEVGYQPIMDGSPAIGAGASCYSAKDQRGYARGATCDIGAYEYPSSIGSASQVVVAGGNNQFNAPLTTFPRLLAVAALDVAGSPVPGQSITFTAPATGPSGTFAGGVTNITASTGPDGTVSQVFTANNQLGDYQVTAELSGFPINSFYLKNIAWFVSPNGNDSSDCSTTLTPCATINVAINKAQAGGAILVASGVYTGTSSYVVFVNKAVHIIGGWNSSFSIRDGYSTIDGENERQGVYATGVGGTMDGFIIQNGSVPAFGGGLLNDGTFTASNLIILNNTAPLDGGGVWNMGNLTLNNTRIYNNQSGLGGGVFNTGDLLVINNSSIFSNFGEEGGGIASLAGKVEINNSTISDNLGSLRGGGLFSDNSVFLLNNVTISGNHSISGGGFYGSVEMTNTILAQNDANLGPDCVGALTSQGYNIIGQSASCTIAEGINDLLDVDPKLATFLPSRGYHPIKANSRAKNSANPLTCLEKDQRGMDRVGVCDRGSYEYYAPGSSVSIEIVDGDNQRTAPLMPFPQQFKVVVLDANGSPIGGQNVEFSAPASGPSGLFVNGTTLYSVVTDVGGVATATTFTANNQSGEYIVSASASVGSISLNVANQALYVSPTGNDTKDCLSPANACLTIAKAITRANDEDMILVATGIYHGSGNVVADIGKNLRIFGGWNPGFTAQTGFSTIDGNGTRSGVIVRVGATVTMGKFIITDSWSNASQRGGVNNFGTLLISDCEISNNKPSYRGGGVFNLGSMTITDCAIKNNTGNTSGGGLYNEGSLTISNSTIQGNIAKRLTPGAHSYGGGVYSEGSLVISDSQVLANDGFLGGGIYSIGDLIVTQSSIKDNTSANGGGLWVQMTADIKNTSITGNTASGPGGGIFATSSALSLTKVTISGNTASSGGGIYNLDFVAVVGSTISMNQANTGGGISNLGTMVVNDSLIIKNLGIESGGGVQSSGSISFNDAVIKDNNSNDTAPGSESPGAGLWISGIAEVRNSSVIGNTASGPGGGVYVSEGALSLVNVTVSGNEASSGGGLFNSDQALPIDPVSIASSTFSYNLGDDSGNIVNKYGKRLTLINSIVIGSSGGLMDCVGTVVSNGFNIIGNIGTSSSPACKSEWLSTDMVGTSSGKIIPEDVISSTLALHSSTGQWRHPLFLGSLALEIGNDALPGSGGNACPATDQLGVARPQGARCDIGAVEYRFESNPPASLLVTFNASNSVALPGVQICAGNTGACASSDASAKSAHQFAFSAYSQFKTWYGRKSIDDNGLQIKSVVHYGNNVDNSFWNGYMLVFGDDHGYALADDIVAHEYAHGVTQYESNLFYWYQSGAINESFSDLWGEAVDQANGLGNDAANVKWLIGEDIGSLGAVRNMANPPQFSDPDSMKSALYCKSGNCLKDNGGVHTNSGVNNKAAYLLVNGGAFGGKTVTALGWTKTLVIYYEAQTNLLSSGSDYLDLYDILYQACLNKIGSQGIAASDCLEVRDATLAVKMNQAPTTTFNPSAPYCPAQTSMIAPDLFSEDFEIAAGGWEYGALYGFSAWGLSDKNAANGVTSLWGDDSYPKSDSYASTPPIKLPVGTKSYLHFEHSFAFEVLNSANYDGGVLEYSINGGSTWLDAKSLFSAGQNYKGVVKSGTGNRLGGKNAFVGDSHGYVDSRYDLGNLAGKTVQFRWRLGTSAKDYKTGWHVDNVKVYRCVSIPAVPILSTPTNDNTIADTTPTFNWSDSKPDLHHYELQIATNQAFTTSVTKYNDIVVSQYTLTTALTPGLYYWRVRAYNAAGKFSAWSEVWHFTIQ